MWQIHGRTGYFEKRDKIIRIIGGCPERGQPLFLYEGRIRDLMEMVGFCIQDFVKKRYCFF